MDVTDLGASTAFAPGVPPGSTVWDMPDDDTMLQQISAMLQQLCDHNAAHLGACPTIFDSVAPPLLLPSVHCFLVRIHCYTEFDSVCFLVALSLIMRLRGEHGPSLRPTTHNIHRLFIAALVVASKTNDGAPRRAPPLVVYHMLTTGPHANPHDWYAKFIPVPVRRPAPPLAHLMHRSQTPSTRTASWQSAAASPTPS